MIKSFVQSLAATDEGWQQFRDFYAEGVDCSDTEAERMRKFIASGDYTIDLDRTSHVQKIVELVHATLPLLAQRSWSLGIAISEAPDFVCSDAPVSAAPTARFGNQDVLHLGNPNTLLTIPLTRRVVLIGRYEKRRHSSID